MVTFLPTPIGNLEDISLQTIKALQEVDILLCEDTRVAKRFILLLISRNIIKERTYQYVSFHSHNQEDFLKAVSVDFFSQNIAFLVDAGMPCISDPGTHLVQYLQRHHLAYQAIGGVSALMLAVVLSGLVEKEFVFLGFPPHKPKQRAVFFAEYLTLGMPVVIFESPHRLLETLEFLCIKFAPMQAFVAKELTKKFEQTFFGDVQEVYEQVKQKSIKGEWVLVFKKQKEQKNVLTKAEIESLTIPPKIKAKLLAKITGKLAYEHYEAMLEEAK